MNMKDKRQAYSKRVVVSLVLWPFGIFGSVFLLDTPFQSWIDEICRYGMILTIWLYPFYLFPLKRFMLYASKRLQAPWFYNLIPLMPVAIFFLFNLIGIALGGSLMHIL